MTTESVSRQQNPDRFEITVDGTAAGFAAFIEDGDQRIFHHTEVSEEFSGQGLAGKLVQQALEATKAEGKRIVPVCPYVAKFVTKTDEFNDVVDKPTPEALALVRQASN